MKILVLGGNGMLGHYFLQRWDGKHEVKVTLRKDLSFYKQHMLFNAENSVDKIDVRDSGKLSKLINDFRPEAVINATGITKQIAGENNAEQVIEINALFPHKLAVMCENVGARMIQFSSDCIFSGHQGFYKETSVSDASDLYGRTKFLGELERSHVVTLRKSTIGLELSGSHGLIEWFLKQKGEIRGFRRAIYSGLISSELVKVVEMILLEYKSLSGIWNVSSSPINKYDLLLQLQDKINMPSVNIVADDDFICDRSLEGSEFNQITGYVAPTWNNMLAQLAQEIMARKSLQPI